MSQLKKNVKYLMEKGNDNPNSLAEKSGAKQPNIFRILEGESGEPRDGTIQPLADYWGVSIADLRFKDLSGGANSIESQSNQLDEVIEFISIYRNTTVKGRELMRSAASAAKAQIRSRKASSSDDQF